jgi:hypothetical protein
MKRLIGFAIGATIGVLVTRYHILDGGEIQAVNYAVDALGLHLWGEAARLFAHAAGLRLAAGLAAGGTLGALIQYMVERQMHLGRR